MRGARPRGSSARGGDLAPWTPPFTALFPQGFRVLGRVLAGFGAVFGGAFERCRASGLGIPTPLPGGFGAQPQLWGRRVETQVIPRLPSDRATGNPVEGGVGSVRVLQRGLGVT